MFTGKLRGQKDIKSVKGYINRQFNFDIDFFERVNKNILDLFGFIQIITNNLWSEENHSLNYKDELDNLEAMSFLIPKTDNNG